MLEQVKGVVFNFAPRSLSTELAAALATLQSRLLAADELREAAVEAHGRIADLALCGPLWNAIAAYDKAGLALRPSGDGVG